MLKIEMALRLIVGVLGNRLKRTPSWLVKLMLGGCLSLSCYLGSSIKPLLVPAVFWPALHELLSLGTHWPLVAVVWTFALILTAQAIHLKRLALALKVFLDRRDYPRNTR